MIEDTAEGEGCVPKEREIKYNGEKRSKTQCTVIHNTLLPRTPNSFKFSTFLTFEVKLPDDKQAIRLPEELHA